MGRTHAESPGQFAGELPGILRIQIDVEEVERLTRIVDQLVALSRLDAGEAQTEWVQFDLAKLAMTTAEQMSLLAEDKGITVACHAKQRVTVDGDRARLPALELLAPRVQDVVRPVLPADPTARS